MGESVAGQIWIFSAVALGIGIIAGWLIVSLRKGTHLQRISGELQRLAAERNAARDERSRTEKQLLDLRAVLEQEQSLRVASVTRLEETQRLLAEKGEFVEQSRHQLEGTYAKLSQEALSAAIDKLLHVVKPHLDGTKGEIVSTLDSKKVEIESLLSPLREMIEAYRGELQQSEQKRSHEHGSLEGQIKQMMEATEAARRESSKVATALSSPKVRGNWGELALRNCVEMAGMTEHCDFDTQKAFENEDGATVRPDMAVRLPGGRLIFVDAKAPMDFYQQAVTESDEKKQQEFLEQHAKTVRRHVEELSRRKYPTSVASSIDFTVLFVGGDQFLSAALATDPAMFEFAMSRKVVLASPTLLSPLLRAIAIGWKADRLEENAQKALHLCQDMYNRFVTVLDHIFGVGKALDGALGKYNEAIRSIDSRLVPKAVELQEFVDKTKPIPEFVQLETATLESSRFPVNARLPIKELAGEEPVLPVDEDDDDDDVPLFRQLTR